MTQQAEITLIINAYLLRVADGCCTNKEDKHTGMQGKQKIKKERKEKRKTKARSKAQKQASKIFMYGSKTTWILQWGSKLTCFLYAGRKSLGFSVSIEIDLGSV